MRPKLTPPPRETSPEAAASPVREIPAAPPRRGGESAEPIRSRPKPRLSPPLRGTPRDLDAAPARNFPVQVLPAAQGGGRPGGGHPGADAGPSIARTFWTVALLGLLVVAAAAVFLVLPQWVEDESTARAAATPAPDPLPDPSVDPSQAVSTAAGDPAPPAADWRDDAQLRRNARDRLETLTSRLQDLEARRIESWGQDDWRHAKASIGEGQASWDRRDFAAAEAAWQRADAHLQAEASRLPAVIETTLRDAETALESGDATLARELFGRAADFAPGDTRATRGLRRAESWNRLAALEAQAIDAVGQGEWGEAERLYSRLLALDAGHAEARRGLERARAAIADGDFRAVMTEALQALELGRWGDARAALDRAAPMKPGAPELVRIRQRLDDAERRETLTRLGARAASLEGEERWREASEVYGELLGIDEHLLAAGEGLSRTARRAALATSLDLHLASPHRLAESAVLAEAEGLLATANGIEDPGPRHAAQVESLSHAIGVYSQAVAAELRSDTFTDVTIYRVGHLGAFDARRVELRPGTYTVVGVRRGFRDVRIEWTIEPGKAPTPLDVRCEERL